MSDAQPRILFVSLTDDVGSERVVCEMGRRGAVCAVLGRARALAAQSVHVTHHAVLPSRGGAWMAAMAVARRLEVLATTWRPDAVVPVDDMAAQVLRDIALARRTSAAVRSLLHASLGDPAHYGTVCSRGRLVEAAARLGLTTPAQARIRDLGDARTAAAAIGFPLMLKREQTCGGSGVTLVRDLTGLDETFRAADKKARAKRAIRRLFGFRSSDDGAALSLQAFVTGGLAMRTVACEAGRVLCGTSFAADRLDPPVTGSSTVIRPIDNAEMETTARRLVAALGCSGFVSFDFLVSADGRATLIEMNARTVGSGHLGTRFGHDLYGAWLRRFPGFRDLAAPSGAWEAPRRIALFPKEMQRDPESPDLATGIAHDVPWDEPRILAAYRDRLTQRHPAHAPAIARRLASGLEQAPQRPDIPARPPGLPIGLPGRS